MVTTKETLLCVFFRQIYSFPEGLKSGHVGWFDYARKLMLVNQFVGKG